MILVLRHLTLFPGLVLALALQASAQQPIVEITGIAPSQSVQDRYQALLAEEEPADSRFTARRQAKRAEEIVLKVLNSEGYFDAQTEITVDESPDYRGRILLSAGPRFTFERVSVEYVTSTNSADTSNFAPTLEPGDFAVAARIIGDERRLYNDIKEAGYPDTKILNRDLIGDRGAGTVSLTYRFDTGPRVCLGGYVLTNPGGVTRHAMVGRLASHDIGKTYNTDDLLELERRLIETRMFDLVNVELDEAGNPAENACERRELLVQLEETPRNAIAVGASFSTTEGPGLEGNWSRRNLTGRLDTLDVGVLLAEIERSLTINWTQPAFRGYGRSLRIGGQLIEEETDAFDRRAISVSTGYDYRVTDRVTLSTGAAFESSREDDGESMRDLNTVNGLVGAAWDGTDSALDPTQGIRLFVQSQPSYTFGDAEGPFFRNSSELRGYTSINADKFVIAGRAKVGSIQGAKRSDIPIDRRFFAGGGGSVRGYGYQQLGPQNSMGEPIGGRSLLEISLEARLRFKRNLGAALFVDAGEAASEDLPQFEDLRAGIGLGFRYYTRFGPLRVDLATPLDPRPQDDPLQLYISIGQAF